MKIKTHHYVITALIWATTIIIIHHWLGLGLVLSSIPLYITINIILIHRHNYKQKIKRINKALELIDQYAGIDGDHHKTWLLDQLMITLADNPEKWISQYENGEDGPETYQWDEGTPP